MTSWRRRTGCVVHPGARVEKIGRITPAGDVTDTRFRRPTATGRIAAGPDGNLWFTDYGRPDRADHAGGAGHRVPTPGRSPVPRGSPPGPTATSGSPKHTPTASVGSPRRADHRVLVPDAHARATESRPGRTATSGLPDRHARRPERHVGQIITGAAPASCDVPSGRRRHGGGSRPPVRANNGLNGPDSSPSRTRRAATRRACNGCWTARRSPAPTTPDTTRTVAGDVGDNSPARSPRPSQLLNVTGRAPAPA